jgi:hypothetical protein
LVPPKSKVKGRAFLVELNDLKVVATVNPVRNSSGALNPAGIILKSDPAALQRVIVSNGVDASSKEIAETPSLKGDIKISDKMP